MDDATKPTGTSATTVTKAAVMAALKARLEADLAGATHAQTVTIAGATHAEARQENDKDTRSTEQSYLARGLAVRVEALTDGLTRLSKMSTRALEDGAAIHVPALVGLMDDDGDEGLRWVFLAPMGGGSRLNIAGQTVTVVTPTAPLGHALLGRCEDDEITLRLPKGQRTMSVVSVA